MIDDLHIRAHAASSQHRGQIMKSSICGCFCCLSMFAPDDIEDWVDVDETGIGQTALCPRCGIDSVLGSASGYPVTPELLRRMSAHWF
jgi:hypothetical protein